MTSIYDGSQFTVLKFVAWASCNFGSCLSLRVFMLSLVCMRLLIFARPFGKNGSLYPFTLNDKSLCASEPLHWFSPELPTIGNKRYASSYS